MFLTDRQQAVSVLPTDLIHIVKTGDTSQGNPAGSSYKAEINQIFELTAGCCLSSATFNQGTITFNNASGGTAFTVSGLSFTGGSGNCINNLYVNNIWPCSVNINVQPQSQGKVFFGALSGASGFTVDLVTDTTPATRLGLNTNTPEYTLDFYSFDRRSRLFYDDDNPTLPSLHSLTFSGNSTLSIQYGAFSQGSWGIALTARGFDNTTYDYIGAQGETALFSSTWANGMNIISQVTNNPSIRPTEDYIRFYAGVSPAAANYQPHIHIQGSGTTRGFMGIGQGNTRPTSLVDISGTTGYDQLRLRTQYNPTSSADPNGNVGDICWGLNGATPYIYLRTAGGWIRSILTGF
jgi:hypothetical protein